MTSLNRLLGLAGLLAIAAGVVMVGLLHISGDSVRVDPVRRTISEYALLDNAWVFNTAVLLVAGGSAAILYGLVRAGVVRPWGLTFVGLLLWSVGLAGVVVYPKHNWAVGPSASGDLHRGLSLVAFVSLPMAALAVGWAWRRGASARYARTAWGLGLLSLLAFLPIPGAFLLEPVTGVRWWRAIPLGLVERGLALAEVATVVALGVWAISAARLEHERPVRRVPTEQVDAELG